MNEKEIRLELERWKGYSAYEVAEQNGFNGTEKEWLASLGAATNITVNERQVDDTGNITLTAEHIMMVEEGQITIAQKFENAEKDTDEKLSALSAGKAQILTRRVTIPAEGWEQDGEIYGQSVEVDGITADEDETSVQVAPGTDRAMAEVYAGCEVRASAQGDGVVVFTCTDKPDIDLEANVMVVIPGAAEESEVSNK